MVSLRGTEGANLLDTIDQLRKLNIDDEISLPQIVVVGQQSAGKSPVLQAISGIKFPTNEGLGTRFPTEVIMRRDSKESASVQIIQNSSISDANLQRRIENFREQQKLADKNKSPLERLPELIEEASNVLEETPSKGLRSESLRVEVTGPKQDHLTLVDLPGLFQTAKRGQNETDPQLIKSLVLKYMQKPRSIILAVVTATTDFANQEILEILKTVDPTGARTMGLITGVDRVTSGTPREKDFMALARNEEIPLELGWHVLRNLDQKERDDLSLDRDIVEALFFETKEPWKDLPAVNCGARELKKQLSHILMNHIGRELGNVVAALDKAMQEQQNILNKLGPERTTLHEQRVFLIELGSKHQSLVQAAVNGQYSNEYFSETGERLRSKIQKTLKSFAKVMKTEGHRWEILTPQPVVFGVQTEYDVPNTSIGGESLQGSSFTKPAKISKVNYLRKVRTLLQEHAGRELAGGYDPLLLGTLFKDQARYWKEITRSHVGDVMTDVKILIEDVTKHLADFKRGDLLLTKKLNDALTERQNRVDAKITELLQPYTNSHPITYNEDYSKILNEVQATKNLNYEPTKLDFDLFSCQQLLECMQSYYNIAIARFVDNVATLGIEMCLLQGLDDLLSPVAVAKMTDEEIRDLAAEFPEDAYRRKIAQSKLAKLRSGRQLCQKHAVAGSVYHGSIDPEIALKATSGSNARSTTDSSTSPNPKPPNPTGSSFSAFSFNNPPPNKPSAAFKVQQESQGSGPSSGNAIGPQNGFSLFAPQSFFNPTSGSTSNAGNQSAQSASLFSPPAAPGSTVKPGQTLNSGSLFSRSPSQGGSFDGNPKSMDGGGSSGPPYSTGSLFGNGSKTMNGP